MKTIQAIGKTLAFVAGAIGGLVVIAIGIPVAIFLDELHK